MWVLDTDVVSHLRRPLKAEPKVVEWAAGAHAAGFYISAITLLEIERGTLSMERKDAAQGAVLRTWLNGQLLPRFAGRILAIDTDVALCCARLHVPNPRAERDALIAATALVHGMTVVTRNVNHFKRTGATLFNPWD